MTSVREKEAPWFDLCRYLETKSIHPQLSSPLYNGRIPAEIRSLIFEFAVTEFTDGDAQAIKPDKWVAQSHDPAPMPEAPDGSFFEQASNIARRLPSQHEPALPDDIWEPEHGFDWLRFDNTEPMRLNTALLLTCRRIYLETCSLPLLQTEQRFYCGRGPVGRNLWEGDRSNVERFVTNWLSNPAPASGVEQKDMVRFVRLFTQQYWLEDQFLDLVNTPLWFTNLEHLQITLRRGDWWKWEEEETLRINPFRGNCYHVHTVDLMHRDMLTETGNIEFAAGAWGKAFLHMSKLKTLTIDFETAENKREEMESIVTWAQKWRFPLADGRHLSTAGRPVSKMSWRGLLRHWSNYCVECGYYIRANVWRNGCPKCSEIKQLISWAYGPQLLVWMCVWKPVEDIL